MLFRISVFQLALQRALRAAVAAHQPDRLQALLAAHGARRCARALSGLSERVLADALSMLARPERSAVLWHLPGTLRRRLQSMDPSTARWRWPEPTVPGGGRA